MPGITLGDRAHCVRQTAYCCLVTEWKVFLNKDALQDS